ncbi:MAG: chorismate mutase [Leptospiraceae bacterium]|nr:chorismate mutase [Leptospiraceae bacterium]
MTSSQGSSDNEQPAPVEDLGRFRREIDAMDRRIVELILKRAHYVHKIGESKKQANTPIYRPDREKQVYQNIRAYAQELFGDHPPLPMQYLEYVYREIMSASIAIEIGGPDRDTQAIIACAGEPGSFAHQAARERFGSSLQVKNLPDVSGTFRELHAPGGARFGVVPVGSIAGTEGGNEVLDRLMESSLQIYAVHYGAVALSLLHAEERPFEHPAHVYIDPISYRRCHHKIFAPGGESNGRITMTLDPAMSARLAANERDGFAVAPQFAAGHYNLKTIESNIQNPEAPSARFYVISDTRCPPTGDDVTTIGCVVRNQAGWLNRILRVIMACNVNIRRIESGRPGHSDRSGKVYLDLVGHVEENRMRKAMRRISQAADHVRILGSYPRPTYSSGEPLSRSTRPVIPDL